MESLEQTSSHSKRKLLDDTHGERIYSFDIDHNSSSKSFCSRSPSSSNNQQGKPTGLGNYQQTTKIIQEFNIQQSASTSDITVSSTINIKSTAKPSMKLSNHDLLSEADFQRVVQDITPADRDLFDEFLNGIKQKTEDYLFLSSLDDIPSSSQEQNHLSQRQTSFSHSSPTSSLISADQQQARRRNSLPRGSSTIHYSPHAMPNGNRPTAVAAQTLKQMAVQHQQRTIGHHHHHPHQQQQPYSSNNNGNGTYSNYPYTENSTRQFYQQSQTVSEITPHVDPTSYYQPAMHYSPLPSNSISTYPVQSQAHSSMYGMQNYSYQTSSSFYQQPMTTSSYPSNGHPPSTAASFHCQDDFLPLLDL